MKATVQGTLKLMHGSGPAPFQATINRFVPFSSRPLLENNELQNVKINNNEIVPIKRYLEYISHHDINDPHARRLAVGLAHLDIANLKKVTIESDRFLAHSLYSQEQTFGKYEGHIQELYEVTLGNGEVMQKYGLGRPYTKEEFVKLVNDCSRRWAHGYPFGGFMIRSKHTYEVVGYEAIGEVNFVVDATEAINPPNTGSLAICLRKAYHRSNGMQDVGHECIAALCLVYGRYLFETKEKINKKYENNKYEGGQVFEKLKVTTRVDNFSRAIPSKIGFYEAENIEKYGYKRILFEKIYQEQKEKVVESCQRVDEYLSSGHSTASAAHACSPAG